MNQLKKKIFVIAGPTAVGKTELALQLARRHPVEIISADSMQVYKYLKIGTDKPTPEQLKGIPYHLIDFVDPSEQFNVAEFVRLADKKITEITQQEKIPLVVGGTGMYIKALLYGIFEEPSKDPEVRKELLARLKNEGLDSLYAELQNIDPEAASRIHPSDRLRILRALEVFYVTGKKISVLQRESKVESPRYKFHLIVLNRERSELYQRIDQRVDKMIKDGLIEEVKELLHQGYDENSPALKALGYRHVVAYLRGKTSLEETIRLIKRDTRHYAKRQLTWFRGMPEARWLNLTHLPFRDALHIVEKDLLVIFP